MNTDIDFIKIAEGDRAFVKTFENFGRSVVELQMEQSAASAQVRSRGYQLCVYAAQIDRIRRLSE